MRSLAMLPSGLPWCFFFTLPPFACSSRASLKTFGLPETFSAITVLLQTGGARSVVLRRWTLGRDVNVVDRQRVRRRRAVRDRHRKVEVRDRQVGQQQLR